MKKRFNLGNLLFNMMVALFAVTLGMNPLLAVGGAIAGGTALSYMPGDSVLRAGVLKELWTDIIMEGFYPKDGFISEGRDMSALVEYNTLNLAEAGANPDVLIDNTSYPIDAAVRTDVPKTLTLKTLDTESTIVRNVEEMETAYDKMASVVYGHKMALRKAAAKLAAWNWSPASNAAFTPVIGTTGAEDAAGDYLKMSFADILEMRKKFDMLDIPDDGRVLVLNPEHESHLILEDMELYKAVMSTNNMFGFKIYRTSVTPSYITATGVKAAYGVTHGATHSLSSFAFHKDEVMKAIGSLEMFAKYKDPDQKGDVLNFQMRFVALPMRAKAIGAIYSKAAPTGT
jgi:hypothetical protein